jgi:hypothetical protein
MSQLGIFRSMALCLFAASAMGGESQVQKWKDVRNIPLSDIISTSPQKELRSLYDRWAK